MAGLLILMQWKVTQRCTFQIEMPKLLQALLVSRDAMTFCSIFILSLTITIGYATDAYDPN